MTLRLDEREISALREQTRREGRSIQEVARRAIRDYVDQSARRDLLERTLDRELPRYAETLRRLGE